MKAPRPTPRIGISACLYGHRVRYDGKDQRNDVILDALKAHVELVPVCPETGIGLGVPRPPIQLVKTDRGIRATGVEDKSIDVTDALIDYASTVLQDHADLCGFIFKSRSPSCGVHDTPLYSQSNEELDSGAGLFVKTITSLKPALPVIDENALQTRLACEKFLQEIFAYHDMEPLKGG